MNINRRALRAKLGSRTNRRRGTKNKEGKPSPATLLRELIEKEKER
jgi:hypothetical protein